MVFKDLVNDMSEKFYVSKAKQETYQGKTVEIGEAKTEQPLQKEKEKSQ